MTKFLTQFVDGSGNSISDKIVGFVLVKKGEAISVGRLRFVVDNIEWEVFPGGGKTNPGSILRRVYLKPATAQKGIRFCHTPGF